MAFQCNSFCLRNYICQLYNAISAKKGLYDEIISEEIAYLILSFYLCIAQNVKVYFKIISHFNKVYFKIISQFNKVYFKILYE